MMYVFLHDKLKKVYLPKCLKLFTGSDIFCVTGDITDRFVCCLEMKYCIYILYGSKGKHILKIS